MRVMGTRDWVRACQAGLPPHKPDVASYPSVSGTANYTCTSFSANPTAVKPGERVQVNLQIRKTAADATNYGFQVRIGELSLPQTYRVVNYPSDYTVSLSAINPSTPTSQWVVGQDYPLSVNVYIPQWAPHGNIPVIITPMCPASHGTITNVTNNIVGNVKIQKFAADPVPWPAVTPTTTVAIENDQANLYVNGNLVSPYVMILPGERVTYQSMGEEVISNSHIWRVPILKCLTYDYGTANGEAENAACFADIDQKINNLLKVDPNAYIYPVFGIRPTGWTANHPSDAVILSDGTTVPYSYSLSSPQFANQIDFHDPDCFDGSSDKSRELGGLQQEWKSNLGTSSYWGFQRI
jgi:hypothetical protein